MSDIREGVATTRHHETLSTPGSTLDLKEPAGSDIVLHDDGSATLLGGAEGEDDVGAHFENLAETLDSQRLQTIAIDLLDAIDVDKEARKPRDQQYMEGLRRTGLGDDAPGGAPFNGASRAVHPMMTEAAVDYAARVCSELLPPDGPVKAAIVGTPSNAKSDRGERTSRYMNYQLTELMPSAYSELETGFSQQGIAGAYYVKPSFRDGTPDLEVVHIDHVHRPWNDGDFYKQPRLTHEMLIDKWTFAENVAAGIWRDVVDTVTSSDSVEQTQSSEANDRIIGRDQPTDNIDEVRIVFETSMFLKLEGPDDELLPYLVTVDEQSRQVLGLYRNWDEDDANKRRLDYLIEFPFMPWRGGYPIGFSQMIGSISGAASGALRALLDSALLATMATGVKLKGGTTAGGQNIRVQPGSTAEVQGSLASDPDIRKTYQQLVFPAPSATLFQLLGFLVDSGRGVVRTSFDEFNKMNGEMPVGTANMMIEQGLKTFGSVFGRQHRAMRRLLKALWYINSKTVTDESVIDKFGELVVTKADFQGPLAVIPVSDPRIFTDTQRMAGAQVVASRADLFRQKGLPSPYKVREVELNVLRSAKVAQPEQYLQEFPEPQQLNAAAENVAASSGLPIKAFPGQDHEAHFAQHAAYMDSPLFGSNPTIALKFLPPMLGHLAEHLSLWYADAMLLSTNAVLQQTFEDPRITVEALQAVKGLEAQLDRLMAEITPHVMQNANKQLAPAMQVIAKAQELLKKLQPPTPMDPSIVAQQDVKRQEQADTKTAEQKAAELKQRGATDVARIQSDNAEKERRAQLEREKLAAKATADQRKDMIAAAGLEVRRGGQAVQVETATIGSETQLQVAREGGDVQLELQGMRGDVQLEQADIAAQAQKDKPKPAGAK